MESASYGSFRSADSTATTATHLGDSRRRAKDSEAKPLLRFLFKGRFGSLFKELLSLPYYSWWQVTVFISVIFTYCIFLASKYFQFDQNDVVKSLQLLSELAFCLDVLISLMHEYWPLVKSHVRVKRRNRKALTYDLVTLIPVEFFFTVCGQGSIFEHYLAPYFFWGKILRIYRLFTYFNELNDQMHDLMLTITIIQQLVTITLIIHLFTCLWHDAESFGNRKILLHSSDNSTFLTRLKATSFDSYYNCWYYCTTHIFMCLFGDNYSWNSTETVLSIVMILIGFILLKCWFIGVLSMELYLQASRRFNFIDEYHHLLTYFKAQEIPSALVKEATDYKLKVWEMKSGVNSTDDLNSFPLCLRMELIFDINVTHLHNSLLLKDKSDAFLRQLSLVMEHHFALAGQVIWDQGVVKYGMVCITKGVVELLSDEDDESPVVAFTTGTVLGETSLIYSIPSKVTVKAANYVEMQVLKRTDFLKVLNANRHELVDLRNQIMTRVANARNRQDEINPHRGKDTRMNTKYRPMKIFKDYLCGVEEEYSPFEDNSHFYFRDKNHVKQRKFIRDYLVLYQRSEKITTVESPQICWRSKCPFILDPNSDFVQMCNIVHFAVVLSICFAIPYYCLFVYYQETENLVIYLIVTNVAKFFLISNLYLQVSTAIIRKKEKIDTIKEIAAVKMTTVGFYLDVLSVFPIGFFKTFIGRNQGSVMDQVFELIPLLQIWHIWDYLTLWEQKMTSNPKIYCCSKYGLFSGIMIYWCGSILYLVACSQTICKPNYWASDLVYRETKLLSTKNAKHENMFLASMYFGDSVFLNVGTMDMSPGFEDRWLVCLLMMGGTFYMAFHMAKVCAIYRLTSRRKREFVETLRELSYFLSMNRVSTKIKNRVNNFFTVQWRYNQAVKTRDIFQSMSPNIRQEILSLEMVDTLLVCPLFQDCSRDFLQTLAFRAKTLVLPDDEIVQHAADISRDMYIIQKGYCNLLDSTGSVVKSIGPDSFFGIVEMVFALPKVYTVVTSTNCKLLHLEYSAFLLTLSVFPEIEAPIKQVAKYSGMEEHTAPFTTPRPMAARLEAKKNILKSEIIESFVYLTSNKADISDYNEEFNKLGIFRYIRYLFVPICITPYGMFLNIWCGLRFIQACFVVTSIPYYIAIGHWTLYRCPYWEDYFLFFDIVVISYVAYYDQNSLLIKHPLLTLANYFKTTFFWDLIPTIPLHILMSSERILERNVYRANKILLITRITSVFSFWEKSRFHTPQIVVLLKYIPFMLTIVNMSSALMFNASCTTYVSNNGLETLVYCNKTENFKDFRASSALAMYFNVFAWILMLFFGTAVNQVPVLSESDQYLVMFLTFVGSLYFAFMFAYIAASTSASGHGLIDHKEKVRDLENFLFQKNVDPGFTHKTLRYFNYIWQRTSGSNSQEICRELNSALMEDTLVYMYEKTLREVPLFSNVEKSFIRILTQHLQEMYFLKGDTVIQCRDVQPYIFVIYRGKVDVLNSYSEMVTCMGPGGMFGNFSGQSVASSDVSILASRSLDLLVIKSQMFFDLMKCYPKVMEQFKRACHVSQDYILPVTMDDGDFDLDSLSSSSDEMMDGLSAVKSRSSIADQSVNTTPSSSDLSMSQASMATYKSNFTSALRRPGSTSFQVWGYVVCVASAASYMLTLYRLITINDCLVFFWVHAALDIFFYIKLYYGIHMGYLKGKGDVILDAKRCRKKYFKNKCLFYSDLIINFPLDPIAQIFPNELHVRHYITATKLLRIKYIWEFYKHTSAQLTNNLTALRAVLTVVAVVLIIHTFACVLLVVIMSLQPIIYLRSVALDGAKRKGSYRTQFVWQYIQALYEVVCAVTAIGSNDKITPPAGTYIILLCYVIGKISAAVMVASTIQVVYSSRYVLINYKAKVNKLRDVLGNQGLSKFQMKKFWDYVQRLWTSERGRQLPDLIKKTPYVRRCDLMSAMFGHHLRNSILFSDTGELFLRQLTVALDFTVYFPGNYIVMAGDCDARMYWVETGDVAVISVQSDLTEIVYEKLKPGDVFGLMQGLNHGVEHCFSYRAETKVTILALALDAWSHILPFFPEAQVIINKRAEALFSMV